MLLEHFEKINVDCRPRKPKKNCQQFEEEEILEFCNLFGRGHLIESIKPGVNAEFNHQFSNCSSSANNCLRNNQIKMTSTQLIFVINFLLFLYIFNNFVFLYF